MLTEVALDAKSPEEYPSDPVTLCFDNALPPVAPIVQETVFVFTDDAVATGLCGACGTVVAVTEEDVVPLDEPDAFFAFTVKV